MIGQPTGIITNPFQELKKFNLKILYLHNLCETSLPNDYFFVQKKCFVKVKVELLEVGRSLPSGR